MTMADKDNGLARLRAVLDLHGAEPRRWPKADIEPLGALVRSDPRAREMLDEERAFERVLAIAPAVAPGPARVAALTGRILQASKAPSPVALARPASVRAGGARRGMMTAYLSAATALAASLIVGFYVGVSDVASPALQQVANLAAGDYSAPNQGTSGLPEEAQEDDTL